MREIPSNNDPNPKVGPFSLLNGYELSSSLI